MSSCRTPDGGRSTGATETAVAEGLRTVYTVSGMSCGHCETALTTAIGGLDSVLAVEVDVDAGLVTVTTGGDLVDAGVARVVDDTGYELTGRF